MTEENEFFSFEQPQSYNKIDTVEVVFDGNNNPIEKENLVISPLHVIKRMAQTLGQTINDPNPNCKKCYGRGYIGRDNESKAPIPCLCLYEKSQVVSNKFIFDKTKHKSRAERRKFERYVSKRMKQPSSTLEVDGDSI